MVSVVDFIRWGLTHCKKATLPAEAILPIDAASVGSCGEWEYLYGTTGKVVTQSLLDSKYSSYYSKHGWSRAEFDAATSGWVEAKKVVCDCQGVEDYFSKSDANARGNYKNYCTAKGLCSAISRPYVLGEAVFNGATESTITHVGFVCGFLPNGDVLVFEERGLLYGFVVTRMSKRAWTYRGLMTKRYEYNNEEGQPEVEGGYIFTRLLQYGCVGDDVVELKKLLIADGYSAGITTTSAKNRNFLGTTRKRVREYQADNGLTVDGKAGRNTITALGGRWAG